MRSVVDRNVVMRRMTVYVCARTGNCLIVAIKSRHMFHVEGETIVA